MITIIHGDDISASRNYFLDLKSKQKNLVSFDYSAITITDLEQNIHGSGLFSEANGLSIENLLTKGKKTDKNLKEILTFIDKNSKEFTFFLWESKEIQKRDLSFFKNSAVKLFKLPKNIFLLLDSLKPSNSEYLIKLFHQSLDNGVKEELILFMIQRQFRLLLALSSRHPEHPSGTSLASGSQIDEISRLAPWQLEKLERQAQLFNIMQLKAIYKKLYEIETGQKTGTLSLSLIQSIDILLLKI